MSRCVYEKGGSSEGLTSQCQNRHHGIQYINTASSLAGKVEIDEPRAAFINFKDESKYQYNYTKFFMLGHACVTMCWPTT